MASKLGRDAALSALSTWRAGRVLRLRVASSSSHGDRMRSSAAMVGRKRVESLPPFNQGRVGVRQYGIIQTIKSQIKGEIESNPELKKSIEELKQKAGTFADRTKAATMSFKKKVDGAREEAEATARQVSSAVKEKVSAATDQVKETVESLRPQFHEQKSSSQFQAQSAERSSASESANGAAPRRTEEGADSKRDGGGGASEEGKSESSSENASRKSSNESVLDTVRQVWTSAAKKLNEGLSTLRQARAIDAVNKGYQFVREELSNSSPRGRLRHKEGEKYEHMEARRDVTAVVISSPKKKSGWEKRWEELKEKARKHPIYMRLQKMGEPVITKSQEMAEDIRDRWETSDSAVVHRIQDLNESIFGETATAAAMREIRRRDPNFTLTGFIQEIQEDVRPVLLAYLQGDLAFLLKKCRKEVVERCQAERRALHVQGLTAEDKVLHISDIEVRETKLLQNDPIIIVGFQTQQVHWISDRQGKIIEGGKDDIMTVYYAWAVQQSSPEEEEEAEGGPQWRLREMQQLGVQALI